MYKKTPQLDAKTFDKGNIFNQTPGRKIKANVDFPKTETPGMTSQGWFQTYP